MEKLWYSCEDDCYRHQFNVKPLRMTTVLCPQKCQRKDVETSYSSTYLEYSINDLKKRILVEPALPINYDVCSRSHSTVARVENVGRHSGIKSYTHMVRYSREIYTVNYTQLITAAYSRSDCHLCLTSIY